MLESHVTIKPLSVNDAWQGRRYKTPAYKNYEKSMRWLLPNKKLSVVKGDKLQIHLIFYFSNVCSDVDNPVKPFVDILQKKYRFNDSHVYRMILEKVMVKKGKEGIYFEITKM